MGPVELESTTSTMSTWRSNQLSYDPMLAQEQKYYIIFCEELQYLFFENKKTVPNRAKREAVAKSPRICYNNLYIVKEVQCMASKKDNLPVNVDVDLENGGTIRYANEVIAIIAGVAAGEVDGIAGMATSGGISLGRKSGITRGIKIEVAGEDVGVEIYIVVEYGSPIQKVASEVQENVRKAIETMTGLHVVKVDVHVQGVSFEMEKKRNEMLGITPARRPCRRGWNPPI